MRVFLVCALVAAATALGIVAGCNDLGVGRKCLFAGSVDGGVPPGTTISSPSLECLSRLCFLQEGMMGQPNRSYCTAQCNTDDDCKGALTGNTPGLCNSSFVCAVATSVGPFGCKQLCLCKDDLVVGVNKDPVDGGVICPTSCQAAHKCPPSQ